MSHLPSDRNACMNLARCLLALISSLAVCGAAFASPPPAASIWWMAVAPDGAILLRLTGDTLFRTENDGAKWLAAFGTYQGLPFDARAPDRYEADFVDFPNAHRHAAQIALSLAHGAPWSSHRGAPVRTADDGRLFCLGNRLYARQDQGRSWKHTATLPVPAECGQMLADGDTLLISSKEGLFRSDVHGRTWHAVPMPPSMRGRWLGSFHALSGQGIFADVYGGNTPAQGRFARSTDAGLHWEMADFPAQSAGSSPQLVGAAHGKLYAASEQGLTVSADAGKTWRADTPRTQRRRAACWRAEADTIYDVQGGPNGALYVATRSAIYKRSKPGAAWKALPVKALSLHTTSSCSPAQVL
ncbi:exo-alpha-sialidase [Massilia violaceinigra]|uniref:Exo-alpha-sialidase n=1 Tax=Massilia violaceinigra TaxID=2045208 RepID=A0ABY4A6M0_9BURK|nr:sialidase family protein [Massilia violaceinigra]UOD30052.1 exo-alpha-sialidase [Massilia violaceinigra]